MKLKLFKRFVSLSLVLLLCVDSFAAVVSDNDGSAFVTKAEFEALKSNFVNQVDNYNDSIDSKIDGAIAAYLAGTQLSKTLSLEPLISNYQQVRWMHGPYMYFTKRHFNEYTTTAGKYTDTTTWQIINPENRRQSDGDGYLWWYDKVRSQYSEQNITMMLHPYDVPWAWGTGRGNNGNPDNIPSSRGPSIYAAMENESNGWAVYNKDGGFQAEKGHGPSLYARVHNHGSIYPSDEAFGGPGPGTWLQPNTNNTDMTFTSNTLGENELANYTISNIRYGNASTLNTNGSIQSIIRQDWNPSLFTSTLANLWANGDGGFALKTACGYEGYMGDNYSRSGNSLVEDNRWATKTQFEGDMANFIYGIWGANVSGEMNVAPPFISSDFNYIDLSKSPNHVTVPYRVKRLGFNSQNSWGTGGASVYGNFQASTKSPYAGSMNLTFPLFYRVKWADMLSGEFKLDKKSLCKSDGFPIITNADRKGEIKLTIEYEERASTDPSVVTLTVDNKIKLYFKNKPFTDNTGTYYKGYKNLDGKDPAVELNGLEWTDGKITLNIPIEKNDSVWMRIDPLTSNGVYCAMTNYKCEFVTE